MNDKAYKFSTRDDTTFMVDGGGSGVMVVDIEIGEPGIGTNMSLKKTWQEIYDAMAEGVPVFALAKVQDVGVSFSLINGAYIPAEGDPDACYTVLSLIDGEALTFGAQTPDDYPALLPSEIGEAL